MLSSMKLPAILQPFAASARDPFDLAKAGHLWRRAAFAGSLAQRQESVQQGVEQAVSSLLDLQKPKADPAMAGVQALADLPRIRSYWLWRMLAGEQRLRQRMTYFWHGHFATSNQKVQNPRMMLRQVATLHDLALEIFDDLLLAVSRNPAMIRFLDNDSNKKGRANENYARELFELFALGRGQYSEEDIREAARAFTGWHIKNEEFFFDAKAHDTGSKSVFGKHGAFDGSDIVGMTVQRPESATFLCRKLLAFFVHPQPEAAEVQALAQVYQDMQRDLGKTLSVLLRSRLFFSPRAYRSRVKSPADLVLGLVRSLGSNAAPMALSQAMGRLGEVLLEPPSVEGWHQERPWLTSATWILRSNFAASLFAGGSKLDPGVGELFQDAKNPKERADLGLELLLDGDVAAASRQRIRTLAQAPTCAGAQGAMHLLHAIQCLEEGQML